MLVSFPQVYKIVGEEQTILQRVLLLEDAQCVSETLYFQYEASLSLSLRVLSTSSLVVQNSEEKGI